MLNITDLDVGDRVCYIDPHDGKIQNGKVKEIPEHTNNAVRVVYNCDGKWSNFMDYTSQLTNIENLVLGWKYE